MPRGRRIPEATRKAVEDLVRRGGRKPLEIARILTEQGMPVSQPTVQNIYRRERAEKIQQLLGPLAKTLMPVLIQRSLPVQTLAAAAKLINLGKNAEWISTRLTNAGMPITSNAVNHLSIALGRKGAAPKKRDPLLREYVKHYFKMPASERLTTYNALSRKRAELDATIRALRQVRSTPRGKPAYEAALDAVSDVVARIEALATVDPEIDELERRSITTDVRDTTELQKIAERFAKQ